MQSIETIARTRAELAAKVEHLTSMPATTEDKYERLAHEKALNDARDAYLQAEKEYQRATSTLTTGELESVLRGSVV